MIVGIDLGTTYSAVAAVVDGGRPRILANRLGEPTTPSCVAFLGPDEVLVGALAKDQLRRDPRNCAALIKRNMGTDFPLTFHGVDHTPESVSALILRAVVADAAAELGVAAGTAVRAVITVPAYFGTREREATQLAAEMAGIEVLELVAEPVAAALYYGVNDATDRTALVYDLGGGTFDCTVLRSHGGEINVLATDGDPHLGGAEVDERLGAAVLDRLAEEDPDLVDDDGALEAITNLVEIAKRNLAHKQSHPLVLRRGDQVLRTDVGRDLLVQASQDLVDRSMGIVDRLLRTVGDSVRLDEIVLVGGSSRLPAVQTALTARFGQAPRMVDPELAVALGAAVRAEQLTRAGESGRSAAGRAVTVLPRGVGVLVRDSNDPEGLREYVQHVLGPNTPLPARATTPFATIVDDQETVRIRVFEQAGAVVSEEVEHNRPVLDGEFTGLKGGKAGTRVDVTVMIGTDGRITVSAQEAKRGRTLQLEAFVEGVVDGAAADAMAARTSAMTIRQ